MKLKTSVTLAEDVVRLIDRAARKGESRSRVLERLVREGLAARARRDADERDRALIDRHAQALNAEAEDALAFQVEP
jgi:metal-responsive CopG/Arc/MetJ family transcriptional regulator